MDDYLDERGYLRTDPTIVMTCDSLSLAATAEPLAGVQPKILGGTVDADWFEASVELSRLGPDRRDDYRAILARVLETTEERGQRLAERVLRGILGAAGERGTRLALLSVELENTSARRLYERIGCVERYRYWYREQPPLGC